MLNIELFDQKNLRKVVSLPSSWNEFTLKELKIISDCLLKNKSKQEMIISILKKRAKTQKIRLPRNWIYKLSVEDCVKELLPIAEIWLEKNQLTKQPFPKIGSLFGPDDFFDNITCGEFEDTDIYFVLFSINKDSVNLQKLAQTLWRPLNENRKRIAFENYQLPRLSSFSRLKSAITLHIIYLWYSGCRLSIMELFPEIFLRGIPDENNEPEVGAFTKLIHSGAGERNGNREEIRAMPLKEFLFDCQLQIQAKEAMEAELKNK